MIRRLLGQWTNAWHLAAVIAVSIAALNAALLLNAPGIVGVRAVAMTSARCSLVLFCLAFTASAMYRLWPTGWTHWQQRNRRYLGLSFAFSHIVHLAAIIAFARLSPAIFSTARPPFLFGVLGGIGYALILAMTITSFRRTAVWIGQPRWRLLHKVGSYYLWATFLIAFRTYMVHHPESLPHAVVAVLLLLAAVGVRVLAYHHGQRSVSAGAFISR